MNNAIRSDQILLHGFHGSFRSGLSRLDACVGEGFGVWFFSGNQANNRAKDFTLSRSRLEKMSVATVYEINVSLSRIRGFETEDDLHQFALPLISKRAVRDKLLKQGFSGVHVKEADTYCAMSDEAIEVISEQFVG